MAKKAKNDFIMSQEIRTLLRKKRSLTGPEVYAALTEKFPGQEINKSSCGVAFTGARKKLGIKGGRRRKSGAKRTVVKARPAPAPALNIETLKAAAKFVGEIGDADKAIAAIKQVSALQIK